MIDIKSLDNLTRVNETSAGPYDLYSEVIVGNNAYAVYSFPCTHRHDMRMDLVCFDIYQNTGSIDVICNINGIMNPLTVQDGDTVYYVDPNDLDTVRSDASVIAALVSAVAAANSGKAQKNDPTRAVDKSNKSKTQQQKIFVPPHIAQSPNVTTGNGSAIILSPNF